MPRPFSTDVPSRHPQMRKGTIKAVRRSGLYQVDFDRGSEWAWWAGSAPKDLGVDVLCQFEPSAHAWWIVA